MPILYFAYDLCHCALRCLIVIYYLSTVIKYLIEISNDNDVIPVELEERAKRVP